MSTSIHDHADLIKHLERWVDEELISRAEAEAIVRFERRGEAQPHRVSLVTEAIGYVGAALLLAAGASLAARFWEDMDELARITVLAVATLVLLGLGWAFRLSAEPAVGRLAGVLWVGAVGATAALGAVITVDVVHADGRVPAIVAGVVATALAAPLYAIRSKALQHVALFAAATLVVGAVFGVEGSWIPALAVWAFAAAWIAVTAFGALAPERAGYAVGSLGVLSAAQSLATTTDAGLWLGLASSIALLGASVFRRDRVLLGFGVVGMFAFMVGTLAEYLGGGAGMAAGLAASGLLVLVVALLLSRRTARRRMAG